MPIYRILIRDAAGRVGPAPADVECPDDEAAVAKAQQIGDGHPVEIWQQARLVAVVSQGGKVM